MLNFLRDFISIPGVGPALIGAATWLGHKLFGAHVDAALARVNAAISEASALMDQIADTSSTSQTADGVIMACKGAVAYALAKIGVYEKDRAPYQPLIDAAIAKAVARWIAKHPSPSTVNLPIARAS